MALSFSNEQRDRGGVEINRPIAALRLGRLNSDAMLLVLLKRSLDPEGLLFGVEIGPAQGQQLAPTRASQAGRIGSSKARDQPFSPQFVLGGS